MCRAFATDPDRLARFQREAQVLVNLNHPGIAAIYGIEEQDETRALVLGLVEGPTLADRIAQGPIPVDEALPFASTFVPDLLGPKPPPAHTRGAADRGLSISNSSGQPRHGSPPIVKDCHRCVVARFHVLGGCD